MNRFVDPPPAAPSPLLGKTAAPYSFVDLQGNSVSDTSLAGKVVILDMWTTWCGYCLRSLPNLQRVYQRYRDDSRVAILAVSNDAADVSDDKVAAALRDIGVTIPLVRDRSELAKSVFQVSVLPTMIVLSPAGVVEHVEIGYRADLPETLPKQIDALLSGQPLFPAVLEEYARAKRRHDDQLAEATVGLTRDIELPEVDIAPASEPASFNRTQLWASQEVKSPGNVLVVEESGGERRLLAIEASRDVVEIRLADGAVAQRHALDLPAGAAISFLRTAVDGAGRRYYAAFASAQQQVFVFDADWKLGAAYPPEGKHPGLSDATLADLDGDGQLELHVGYWGPVGVQTANLAGKRLRSNRSLENIMRLIPIGPGADGQSRLLCAAGGQAMIWLNHDLEPAGVIPTPSRGVYTMLPRSAGNEPADFAALSSLEVGVTKALGVGADGHERWAYDLPRGVARYPADPIALVRLGAAGDPAWLFPAADGSLHFLASDGQLLDRFNYGRLATGATGAEIGGQPALIVATPEDIAAWRISPK